MAITTLAGYQNAEKRELIVRKIGLSNVSHAQSWWSSVHVGIPPGASGTGAVGNTANGEVPDNTTLGAIEIPTFSGTGYITSVEVGASVVGGGDNGGLIVVYDRLFHCGAYNANTSVTLSSQPSYGSRVPSGDYNGLQIWYEFTAASTGVNSCAVDYTNQSGVAARTTGVYSVLNSNSTNQWCVVQLPLQAGDSGVMKIEKVANSLVSTGTAINNIVVARPLFMLKYEVDAGRTTTYGMEAIGMPAISGSSCLAVIKRSLTASASAPNLLIRMEVASG